MKIIFIIVGLIFIAFGIYPPFSFPTLVIGLAVLAYGIFSKKKEKK